MQVKFETWKKLVEGAKITKAELKSPESLWLEFDTGMVCYVYSSKPIGFNFNWSQGYKFLSDLALEIYLRDMNLI